MRPFVAMAISCVKIVITEHLLFDQNFTILKRKSISIYLYLKELTQTVKSQPWRLIWPSTKKYPEDNQTNPPDTITVKKTAKTQRRPSPTPAPRTR